MTAEAEVFAVAMTGVVAAVFGVVVACAGAAVGAGLEGRSLVTSEAQDMAAIVSSLKCKRSSSNRNGDKRFFGVVAAAGWDDAEALDSGVVVGSDRDATVDGVGAATVAVDDDDDDDDELAVVDAESFAEAAAGA